MSVPTAETIAPDLGARDGVTREVFSARLSGWRMYGILVGAAFVIATLSLLIPSTPSYDPWAWLVWGHEILHLSLHTPGGPTWKPLPVIFTTIFAIFGHYQPDLWLIVARMGTIMAAFMTFKLAARLTWWLRDEVAVSDAFLDRLAAAAPALLAGSIAMVGLVLSGNLVSDGALGYSEGLLTAAVLIAVERHIDGHTHQAFFFGFVAALDRPETWVFWGPYGLWLMWKDPSSRALVVGLAVLTLFLWFVPQKWGGGSLTSGVSRAQQPRSNSAAFASCPFCTELADHAWPLVLLRLKVAALLVIGVAAALLGRAWRARPGRSFAVSGPRERAIALLAVCGLFGFAWWILIAVETQAGFSGNDRYLVLGSAFIEVCGGAGFGWAAYVLVGLWRRTGGEAGGRLRAAIRLPWATAMCGVAFLIVPNWVGGNLIDIPATHRALIYQAHLREDLAALIKQHGGAKGINACGQVMTEGFQVPMVAWYLGLRTIQVDDQPAVNAQNLDPVPKGAWPNVIFQDSDTRDAALLPLAPTIIGWEHEGAHYTYEVSRHNTFHFFEDCRK